MSHPCFLYCHMGTIRDVHSPEYVKFNYMRWIRDHHVHVHIATINQMQWCGFFQDLSVRLCYLQSQLKLKSLLHCYVYENIKSLFLYQGLNTCYFLCLRCYSLDIYLVCSYFLDIFVQMSPSTVVNYLYNLSQLIVLFSL